MDNDNILAINVVDQDNMADYDVRIAVERYDATIHLAIQPV